MSRVPIPDVGRKRGPCLIRTWRLYRCVSVLRARRIRNAGFSRWIMVSAFNKLAIFLAYREGEPSVHRFASCPSGLRVVCADTKESFIDEIVNAPDRRMFCCQIGRLSVAIGDHPMRRSSSFHPRQKEIQLRRCIILSHTAHLNVALSLQARLFRSVYPLKSLKPLI